MVIEIVANPVHDETEIITAENVQGIAENVQANLLFNKYISKTLSIVAGVLIIIFIMAAFAVLLLI